MTLKPTIDQRAQLLSQRLGELAARLRTRSMPPPFGSVVNHLHQPRTAGQEAMERLKRNELMIDDGK